MSSGVQVKKPSKVELPNKDEQLSLQNAEILVKSNLMRMQIDELLVTVRDNLVSTKRIKFDGWVSNLCDTLRSCKTGTVMKNLTVEWLQKANLKSFVLEGHRISDIAVDFEKPESVHIVGSHSLHSGTSPHLNCDIAVVMPKDIFDSRDVLNHVYFNKRKLYLAALSEVLTAAGFCGSIEVSNFKSDSRKPFLILKPQFKTKYTVHLYVCAPNAVFKLVQLLPSKNNVRPDWWMKELQVKRSESEPTGSNKKSGKKAAHSSSNGDRSSDPAALAPTPHYNMAILEDLAVMPQYHMLMKASEACPCFVDVCILLKIWLTQKNLRFGMNDLGGHCIQIVVAYLFQTRRIGVQTTKLGAFQVVISFLAQTDFASADLHFTGAKSSQSECKWSAKLYHPVSKDIDDVQFNSLWRISFSAVQDLQNEARIALGLLQQESNTAFSRIFLEERHFLSRYDLLFQIPLKNISSSSSPVDLTDSVSSADGADRAEDTSRGDDETIPQFLCSKVFSIARRALTNRVKYISSSLRDSSVKVGSVGQSHVTSSWDRHSAPVNSLSSLVVTLGLVLDNDNAHRRVDKGADSSSAGSLESDQADAGEMFRSFWGSKSELRRFKDGAIVDAVVWGEQDIQTDENSIQPASSSRGETSVSTPREVTGVAIVEAIVRYSLCRHVLRAAARGEYISCLGGTLEALLPSTNYTRRGLPEGAVSAHQKSLDSTPKMRYLHAIEALDKLRSILTSDIKDLPLVFESITGAEAALRYTSFVPPMPSPLLLNTKDKMKEYSGVTLSLLAQPLQIIGQVEGGGKWPTEVEAARKVKTALLLRTGSLLRSQFEVQCQPAHNHLDIFYRGYIFRLVIFFTSENPSSGFVRSLQDSCVHHQAIRALHTQHSDSFSTAVRLLSLWTSKQCFSGLLSHRQIELLAAAVYLDPTSVCAPTTSSSALFRILDMLGKHDFDLSPIVVNFAPDDVKGAFAHKVASTIQAFNASHKSSGSSLLIVSSTDFGNENDIARISDSTIDTTSLHLIQSKARESALKLVSKVLHETEPDSGADSDIFTSSALISECCNIILHFSSAVQCKGGKTHLNGPKYASLKVYSNTEPSSCTAGKLVVADRSFSSMNSLQEGVVFRLRKQFQDVAIFFWDDTQGDRLGVTLKPKAFLSSAFSSTDARRKISITEGLKAHPPVLADISQIAMNIYVGGNGCFSDISFQ